MTRQAIIPRRGLRASEAALYVGLSATKFLDLVKDGRMPKPVRIDGCVLWDVRELDRAWDDLTHVVERDDTWGDFDGAKRRA